MRPKKPKANPKGRIYVCESSGASGGWGFGIIVLLIILYLLTR